MRFKINGFLEGREKRNSVPDILNRIKIEDKELGNFL